MQTQSILNVPLLVLFTPTKDHWMIRKGKLAKRYGELSMGPQPTLRREQMDAWELRSNFLANMPDKLAVLNFLNNTGRFSSHQNLRSIQEFQEWQGFIHNLLESRSFHKTYEHPRYYELTKVLDVENEFRFTLDIWKGIDEGVAIIDARSTLQAVAATVLIDRIRKTKIRFCARPDCGKPYEVTSAHQRKYCEPYCAHFESVRRLRRKQRAEQTPKERV